jgi:hypothetical protein
MHLTDEETEADTGLESKFLDTCVEFPGMVRKADLLWKHLLKAHC